MKPITDWTEAWEFVACWYYATRGILPQDGLEDEVDFDGGCKGWAGLCDFIALLVDEGALGSRVVEQMERRLEEYPNTHKVGWLWYWKKGSVAPRVRYCLQQANESPMRL